ncbi:PP2C family protein-serine/threonine phosphatase [Oxalobacteraceae bacterium A2-2]
MNRLWPFRAAARSADGPARRAGGQDFGPLLDIAARSSPGVSKLPLENQDNLLLIDAHGHAVFLHDQQQCGLQLEGWPAGHVRLAVLDGMGGHGQGREAAEAAVQGLLRVPACSGEEELSLRLDALHAELQQRFRQPGDSDSFRRPGTTLTLLELPPGQAPLLYHVGDSRLYEITAAQAAPLTVDHVPATACAMQGMLDEHEWRRQVHHEHRVQIAQAYILGNAFAYPQVLDDGLRPLDGGSLPAFLRHLPDRRALPLNPDALYLLATDGFWSCASPHRWTARWPALLASAPTAAAALDRLFGEFSDHPPPQLHIDNLTAIMLRYRPILAEAAINIDETALPEDLR